MTGLGKQGWEDCGFLQLSQLEFIYKAVRTEALRKKPQNCKSWHKKQKISLASVLHCPSPALGRVGIKHSTLLLGVLVIWGSQTQLGPTLCDILEL